MVYVGFKWNIVFCVMVFVVCNYDFCRVIVDVVGDGVGRKVIKDNWVNCINVCIC